jgi:ABC-type cobalamin/Fe3+-siderophores transport system ATPase subunit
MIEFRDVSVRYPGAAEHSLQGVTLVAERGAVTAVAGPNGSGKSTLVRALLRVVSLASGSVTIDGIDVRALSRRAVARRVAVVPQREEPAFPLLVRDYVAIGRYPHSGLWAGAPTVTDTRAIEAAVARAGIGPLATRRTDQLSGGEWQRVRIARALAQSPEDGSASGSSALVLDEPTTFLDVAHEMSVFELLATLARAGAAVLLVTHQLNLVARFADHMVLLHRGAVAASGAPGDVMQASVLERVYEWPLVVTRDPAVGAPTLVPLRSSAAQPRAGP